MFYVGSVYLEKCIGFSIEYVALYHSELFLEFRGGKSLGLKTTSCGVFLFVHDCLITHLSWKILLRPKRSNLK